MSTPSNFPDSSPLNNWQKSESQDGAKILLRREVQIGEKEYTVEVAYRKAGGVTDKSLELTLEKVVRASEAEIMELVDSLAQQPEPVESMTVQSNSSKKVNDVFFKTLDGSLRRPFIGQSEIESRANRLIQSVSNRFREQAPLQKKAETASSSKETALLATYKKEVKEKLEGLLQQREGREADRIDEYGAQIWTVDGVEIKDFGDLDYYGPMNADFENRRELVYQALVKFVKDNKGELPKVEGVLAALKQKHENFKALTPLNIEKMKKEKGAATDYFAEVNKQQVQAIAEFACEACEIVSRSGKECTIKDLDRLEREVVRERGRPVVANLFTINGQKFFSMQTPLGECIPSTLRDGAGLGNYVSTSFGTINEGQCEVQHLALRHTSYASIAIKDPCLRQAHAVDNVKQVMKDLARTARKNQQGGASEEDPLNLSLRSMILLTPLKGDTFYRNRKQFVRGEWTGESESQQLRESVLALATMRDRVVALDLDGETVYVKLDSSVMNLGANKEAAGVGLFGKIPHSSFESEINPRGYLQFISDVENYLSESLPENLQEKMKELIRFGESSEHPEKKRELDEFMQVAQGTLIEKKEELEELYDAYKQTPDPQIAEEIAATRSLVVEIEKRINHIYGALYALRMDKLDKLPRIKEFVAETHQEILSQLEPGKTKDIFMNYLEAKKLYQTKAYKRPETVMEFQTLYLQTYQEMGYMTEFFCKSGEDRTGRVDNKVQERFAYRALGGEEDAAEVPSLIHAFSASRDNTRYNSEAPGLQIGAAVNREVTAKIDHAQATMAKRVIKKAAEIARKKAEPSFAKRMLEIIKRFLRKFHFRGAKGSL